MERDHERSTPGTDPDTSRLQRQVAGLRWGLIVLGLLWLGTVAWIAFRPQAFPAVLAVERLEIVEPDGQLAFVIASSQHPEAATVDGQVLLGDQEEERRHPSFIFFDGKGDEVGGMVFANEETEDGFNATRHLSLDGYKQDQTVVLAHYQDQGGAASGLFVSDRPEDRSILEAIAELGLEPGATRQEMTEAIQALPEEGREARLRELFGVNRLFVGSSRERQAAVMLHDGQGRPRLWLGVPDDGEPFIRILDEEGDVVLQLPE
jgi:hypothetical protein